MFKSQRSQSGLAAHPDAYAAFAVLPGEPLPPAALTVVHNEQPPAAPAPEPVPDPTPVAVVPASVPAPPAPPVPALVAAGPAPAPPSPRPPGPPANWYPDPSGRFAHRYWDGAAWTEHTA